MHSYLVRALSLSLPLLLVACGASTRTDETTGGTDGGQQSDAGPADAGNEQDAGPLLHDTYVPPNQHPTGAARLIVIGDSISAGYGATSDALSYYELLLANNNSKWPDESSTTLSTLFGSEVTLVNVAVPGATTSSMLSQRSTISSTLGDTVSGHSIAVITIGGNDMKNYIFDMNQQHLDGAVNSALSNVRTMINYLQDATRFPDGVSIYLATVYDPSDDTGMLPSSCFGFAATNVALVTSLGNLKARYTALGQELSFSVVDALGHFHRHGVSDSATWFASDCIHPNDSGHNELRRLFFEAIDVGHYTATDF